MANWLVFAEVTGNSAGLLSVVLAIVTGCVTIITTLITARAQVMAARAQWEEKAAREVTPPTQDSERDKTPREDGEEAVPSRTARILNLVMMACGLIVLLWGVYSYSKIHQLGTEIAHLNKEIVELNKKIAGKEEKFKHLNQSFDKSSGITVKPVNIKSEYTPNGNTRSYHIWVEADVTVIDKIDHVKYIFDDTSWRASPVLTSDVSNRDGRKHFLCEVWSPQAITYITVLIMYQGYKETGAIQPINYHWRAEARPAE
jgi:cell division protein FtsL